MPRKHGNVKVGAHDFRERFGCYMERAAAGDEILVTRHGRPFVRLVPAEPRQLAISEPCGLAG